MSRSKVTVFLLLAIQSILIALLSWQTSLNRTEAGHIGASIYFYKTFRFDVFHVNPPLTRAIVGLPILLSNPEYDWKSYSPRPQDRSEWQIGNAFINANNFVFEKSDDFLAYINRSQFLLQQGLFVGDVLEFYGENVPNFTQMKWANTAKSLPGYDYDVATEEVLLNRMSVQNGLISLADGTQYQVLVLPERSSISGAVLKKLEPWVTEGGLTVIGPKPTRISGLEHIPKADHDVHAMAEKLWGNNTAEKGIRNVGKGRVAWGMTSHELLAQDGLTFDFARLDGTNSEPRVDSIHRVVYKNQLPAINLQPFAKFSAKDTRTTPADMQSGVDAHVYFVANLSKNPDNMRCAFRVAGKQPELWDALTGEIRKAVAFEQKNDQTIVPLDMAGHGSIFVVFDEETFENNDLRFLKSW